jgi:hypothetical protein
MRATRWVSVVAVVLVLVGAACSSGSSAPKPAASKVVWPAPADPMARTRAAGLVPDTHENLVHHVHAHLDVFVDGQAVTVPAGLGINIDDPAVKVFDIAGATGYGGIDPACEKPCISPLHTHDVTGVIHTESPTNVDNTLGELFVEWGVKLDAKCVDKYCRPDTKIAIYVDGTPFTGDPRKIALTDHKEIAIVIGSPPADIPSAYDFG